MKATADARLVLLAAPGSHRQRTTDILESEGVSTERVEFVEPHPRHEYLQLYHRLDLVLDTFPYTSGWVCR
jgi:predicted O-linked N-acetylglucosamine transferase (SPINDLY family)